MISNKTNNALTHGLYASESVLPWESPQAFADLHESIREELNPCGQLEENAVLEVAELHWRKQRLSVSYLLPYHKTAPAPELVQAAQTSVPALAAYLAQAPESTSGSFVATTSQLFDFLKPSSTPKRAAESTKKAQPQASSANNIVEQAYSPANLERYLKIESMLDSRIAKIISRLVCLKEYKKMYGQNPQQAVSQHALLPSAVPPLAPHASPASESAQPSAAMPETTFSRKWGQHY